MAMNVNMAIIIIIIIIIIITVISRDAQLGLPSATNLSQLQHWARYVGTDVAKLRLPGFTDVEDGPWALGKPNAVRKNGGTRLPPNRTGVAFQARSVAHAEREGHPSL
eukprot:3993669-Karenia_brevis.AAC.1